MGRTIVQAVLGLLVAVLIIAGPFAYYRYRHETVRNFRVVTPGVLYRSGQLTPAALDRICRDYRIKTIVTFRGAEENEDDDPDRWEEDYCRLRGLYHFRIVTNTAWGAGSGENSVGARVRRFCDVVSNPKYHPVLVHCYAGIHRTGTYCAVYRILNEGWTAEQAIAEMQRLGYNNVERHQDVYQYLCECEHRRGRQ